MSGWRSLRAHCKDAHRYSLLIKYDIGQSRYTIWLTDLTYLWRESLDQIQIQERASHLNTSIDGQDPDQMDLILRRIADALDNKEGTRVELFSNGGEKRLTLNTSTPLPRPLKPLDWSIMLMPAPQSMMTREFFLPLLNQQFTSKVEKASLVQYLKEKDGVIGRLSDKMLSDGVDLSMVFPGAASSKAGTNPNARQLLSVYIKGLAEFDQELWETRFTNRSGSRSLEDVISQVFSGSLKSPYSLSLPNSGDWWTRLSRRSSESTEFASNERNIPSPEIADEEGFVVEDGFQRPPEPRLHLSKSGNLAEAVPPKEKAQEKHDYIQEHDDSTTDESDGEFRPLTTKSHLQTSRSQKANISSSEVRFAKSPLKLAGGQIQDEDLAGGSNEAPRRAQTRDTISNSRDLKTSEDDQSSNRPNVLKLRKKLGRIGGRTKTDLMDDAKSLDRKVQAESSTKAKVDAGPVTENRGPKIQLRKVSPPQSNDREVVQPQDTSPPRETSQERANKKREQLKRELQDKSQAPMKKKRKF